MFRSVVLGFLLCLVTSTSLSAQWDTYQAVWEGKPGSVLLNMDWIKFAPIQELPYLLVVDTEVDSCNYNGFGSRESNDKITEQNQSLDSLLSLYTYLESVGTFSHDCKVREYFYMKDTIGVGARLRIHSLDRKYTYEVIDDREWLGYLEFLYPDDFLIQTMVNARVVHQLTEKGDDLSKKRKVTHYAGFSAEKNRKEYRSFIQGLGFFVKDEAYDTQEVLPYMLTFHRRDPLEIIYISEITLSLAQKAQEYYGSYDGWEIEIEE